ncbi:MAG: type IV secretion system DNA-binding domain-containing protein [Candidatus Methylomirabilales bacterium]
MGGRYLDDADGRIREELTKGRGDGPHSSHPVALESPYRPFRHVPRRSPPDELREAVRLPLRHLRVRLPREDMPPVFMAEELLLSLKPVAPLSFEVVGQDGRISLQFTSAEVDAPGLRQQIVAAYPMVEVAETPDALGTFSFQVRSYGLKESPVFTLRTDGRVDPFIALAGILGHIRDGGAAAVQILFEPVRADWKTNLQVASRDPFNPSKSPYQDVPDLPKLADKKTGKPLFAVAVRLAATSPASLAQLEGFLASFQNSNGFVRLSNPDPSSAVANRVAYRPGMLLNSEELAALVHLPFSAEVLEHAPLERARLTRAAPELAKRDILVRLGANQHQGVETPVGVSEEWLKRHLMIFGKTGCGKSWLLLNGALDLIERGFGSLFLDPNGDAAEELLHRIPKHRAADTIYFNPMDRDYPMALNVLESSDELDAERLGSDLIVSLQRYFADAWGPRMEWILRQMIRTLLLSRGEKTIRDILRLIFDRAFREAVIATVNDPDLALFWEKAFPTVPKDATAPIVSRISRFADNPIIRAIVGQPNKLNLHTVLREGKILIANLSKGTLGEDNAFLLGSFLLSKFQLALFARASLPPSDRKLFAAIIDEVHTYADASANASSFTTLLSEARKYSGSLVIATQYAGRLHRDVLTAGMGNVGSLLVFQTGLIDSQVLQRELGQFSDQDILNLGVGEAIVRMGRAEEAFNIKTPFLPQPTMSSAQGIIERTRRAYCRPKAEVDRLLRGELVNTHQPEAVEQSTARPAPAEHEGKHPDNQLSNEEKQVLAFVVDHPGIRVTQLYDALGLSGYMGDKLKEGALAKGLLHAVKVARPKGGRPVKLLFVSPEGYQRLGLPVPHGKGGPLHRHLQQVVKQVAERKGYRAVIEESIPGTSATVDVGLEKAGRRIAVEITVTTGAEHTLANFAKCFAAGYHHVVAVFFRDTVLRETEAKLRDSVPETDRGRVRFCTARDIDQLL